MIASVVQEQFSNGSVGARRLGGNSVVEVVIGASLFVERRTRRSASLSTYTGLRILMSSYFRMLFDGIPHRSLRWSAAKLRYDGILVDLSTMRRRWIYSWLPQEDDAIVTHKESSPNQVQMECPRLARCAFIELLFLSHLFRSPLLDLSQQGVNSPCSVYIVVCCMCSVFFESLFMMVFICSFVALIPSLYCIACQCCKYGISNVHQ